MGDTTGVSLKQGLGLTDISRGRPGRRPGLLEASVALRQVNIIYTVNSIRVIPPELPGPRDSTRLSTALVPRSTPDRGPPPFAPPFVEISRVGSLLLLLRPLFVFVLCPQYCGFFYFDSDSLF